MGIWGDAFAWGAKFLVREGTETGARVVAKTVVADGTKVIAKTAVEDGTRVVAKTAVEEGTTTAAKSESALSRFGKWLTNKSSYRVFNDPKLAPMEKLQALAARGDEASMKYMRQLLDRAKFEKFTEAEITAIRNNPRLTPEIKNMAEEAYERSLNSGAIGRNADRLKYVKDHAVSIAARGTEQAVKGTATAAFKTVTWPARNFLSGAWDTLHFWDPLKVTKGLAKMGFSAAVGTAELAGGDQLLTHGKGRKALIADVIGADTQQSVADGLASTGQFLDRNGIPGGSVARFASNTIGTPNPDLANPTSKTTPDKSADGDSGHWYDWLKNLGSSLTGNWGWLGFILTAIAWIAEQVTSLAGSLFSSDTKVQSNNTTRVAAVAGTDSNIQASVVNHNGQEQTPVLDRIVPQLVPPTPAPG